MRSNCNTQSGLIGERKNIYASEQRTSLTDIEQDFFCSCKTIIFMLATDSYPRPMDQKVELVTTGQQPLSGLVLKLPTQHNKIEEQLKQDSIYFGEQLKIYIFINRISNMKCDKYGVKTVVKKIASKPNCCFLQIPFLCTNETCRVRTKAMLIK